MRANERQTLLKQLRSPQTMAEPALDYDEVSVSFPMEREFDGPPQASFELFGKRYSYRTFAMSGAASQREELRDKLKETLADMATRGGVYLFWRRRPAFEFEPKERTYPLRLRARFAVLDAQGSEVAIRIGHKEENADTPKLGAAV